MRPRWLGPVDNCKRYAELQHRADRLEFLAEVGRLASSSTDISDLCERIEAPVQRLIPFDRLELATVDLEAGTGNDISVSGTEIAEWEAGRTFVIAGTPAEAVVETRAGLLAEGDSADAATARYPSEAPALARRPAVHDGRAPSVRRRSSGHADVQVERTGGVCGARSGPGGPDRPAGRRRRGQPRGPVAVGGPGHQRREEYEAFAEIELLLGSATDIDDLYEDVAHEVQTLLPLTP